MRWTAILLLLAGVYPAAADVVILHTGERRPGRIAEFTVAGLKLEVPLERPGSTTVLATVMIPRGGIRSIEFAQNPDLEALLASRDTFRTGRLAALWKEASPWIDMPSSPAGRIGIALAGSLLSGGDPAAASQAMDIFRQVEEKSWNPADKESARQGRLQALLQAGRAEEAAAEAEEIARNTKDSSLLLEAKLQMAGAAKDSLERLQQENPRWNEDPLIGPERNRLYNEALDLSLFPVVHPGAPASASARGLWLAAQIHRVAGDLPSAIECSKDLVTIYPGSQEAALARGLIEAAPAGTSDGAPAISTAAATAAPTPPSAKSPGKQKSPAKKSKTKSHETKTKNPR